MNNLPATHYQLRDEFLVAPTLGLDGARGVVRVVGVLDYSGCPEGATEPFVQGLEGDEIEYFTAATWYAFRYIDDAPHTEWGVMYLPEDSLYSMEKSAASDKLQDSMRARRFQNLK